MGEKLHGHYTGVNIMAQPIRDLEMKSPNGIHFEYFRNVCFLINVVMGQGPT
jgi:hypothetical protein